MRVAPDLPGAGGYRIHPLFVGTRYTVAMRYMSVALLLSCLLLAACASGPVYRPAPTPHDYGYRDAALTQTHYQVSFSGGYGLAQETVRKLALYRAAQLTLQHGADRLRVVSRQTNGITTGGPRTTASLGYGYPFWGFGVGFAPVPQRTRYETVMEIQIGPQVPESGPDVYDAVSVEQHLAGLVAAASK